MQLVLRLRLQNELKSDVARFTTHESNCLATNQVVTGCESCCGEQKVVLLFVTKSVNVARFIDPRQSCLAASDLTPVYGVTPAKFYPFRSQYSYN